MPIISYEVVYSQDIGDNRLEVQYAFTDHLGNVYEYNKRVPDTTDLNADMALMVPAIEEGLARREIADAVGTAESNVYPYPPSPEHQTKQEFIRRFFGGMMQISSLESFNNSYQFFLDFETDPDSGNNKPQRAAYLGVDAATYDLIDKRYGDMAGIQVLLNDEKGRVWTEYPDGYW
jgi:hypothetical protein